MDSNLEKYKDNNLDIKSSMEKLKIVVKKCEDGRLMDVPKGPTDIFPPYSMRGPKRGVVLVINNIEFDNNRYDKRNGAEVDKENLKELFTQLGFEWIYWENQTRKDITEKLKEFTKDSNKLLSEVDSCFVIVMSHGGEGAVPEDTHVITKDNKEFKASAIISRFSNSNCILLRGKPKVIIFQACRGDLQDFAIIEKAEMGDVMNTTESDGGSISQTPSETTISNRSDMLICYTTSPGCRSFRDQFKGAWFIHFLCEIFMNYAYKADVYTLFGMITAKVIRERTANNALQVPHIVAVYFRPCYLNPLPQKKIFFERYDYSLPYQMCGPKRGVAFVIHNIRFEYQTPRSGNEVDAENLKELFKYLGFEWMYWVDQTYENIENQLLEFSENPILNEVDSCFVIIMSYGVAGDICEDTHILTYDNKEFKTSDIIKRFSNSNCKSLRGKPKVVVFQASRGEEICVGGKQTKSVEVISEDTEDMLICYASNPGYHSFRDIHGGAWFIQCFCEIFLNHAHNTDVQHLFDMIATKVSRKRPTNDYECDKLQVPYIESHKFRTCYLNPPPGHMSL